MSGGNHCLQISPQPIPLLACLLFERRIQISFPILAFSVVRKLVFTKCGPGSFNKAHENAVHIALRRLRNTEHWRKLENWTTGYEEVIICRNVANCSHSRMPETSHYNVFRTNFCLCTLLSKEVKWSRYRPGLAQRVGRGIALFFHDRGTRRGWVVSSTPRPHFTTGKEPVPIV